MKPSRLSLALVGLILLACSWGIVRERLHTYWEAQQPEITTFALIGHGLLKGRALYSDLWDHHPPAIYFSYALSEALGGHGPYSIFLLSLLAAFAVLGAVFMAGFLYRDAATGLWAAAFWAVLSGDLSLWANQPYPEAFVNLFAGWAMVFLLMKKSKSSRALLWGGAGLFLFVGSLYVFPVFWLAGLWASIGGWRIKNAKAKAAGLSEALYLAGIPLAGWALLFFYFLVQGRGLDFWGAVFTYHSYIVGQGLAGWNLFKIWPDFMAFGTPFLLMALLGAFRAAASHPRPWVLLAAYGTWVFFEVNFASEDNPVAYQVWLVPLVVGGAWGLCELAQWAKPWAGRWAWTPALLLLLSCVAHELPFYQKWAVDWARAKSGDGVVGAYDFARNLDGFLRKDENFYEWGDETQLYYTTRRDPPAGVFTSDPLSQGPLAGSLSLRVVRDLEISKPELFIFNRNEAEGNWDRNPVLIYVETHYSPVRKIPPQGSLVFFARKGGNLEARLARLK